MEFAPNTQKTDIELYTYFSYNNTENSELEVSRENENRFVVGGVAIVYPYYPQRRTTFQPGDHYVAFQIVSSNSTGVSWVLNGQEAFLATNETNMCQKAGFIALTFEFSGYCPLQYQSIG